MNKFLRAALVTTAAGIGVAIAINQRIKNRRKLEFKDKVVVITGGSRGLGLVLARQFADEGAKLAIIARDEEELEVARKELSRKGAQVLAISCDITKENHTHGAIKRVLDRFDRVDVLINNAGVISAGPVEDMSIREFDEAMNTHFWAPLYMIRAVLPDMKLREEGRIINIASMGGKVSLPHQVPYSASKFALVGLSDGYRAELRKDGIYVTTVCPGFLRTGGHKNAIIKGKHKEEFNWISAMDANPITAMSAEKAAKEIIRAAKYGEPELILTMQGKTLNAFNNLFPSFTAEMMAKLNNLLPAPTGLDKRVKGKNIQRDQIAEYMSKVGDEAAKLNNEYAERMPEELR